MAEESTKTYTCSRCKEVKTQEEMRKRKRSRNSKEYTYEGICKACDSKRALAYQQRKKNASNEPEQAKKEVRSIAAGHKHCPKCEQDKPLQDFFCRVRVEELQHNNTSPYCKSCTSEYLKKQRWLKRNPSGNYEDWTEKRDAMRKRRDERLRQKEQQREQRAQRKAQKAQEQAKQKEERAALRKQERTAEQEQKRAQKAQEKKEQKLQKIYQKHPKPTTQKTEELLPTTLHDGSSAAAAYRALGINVAGVVNEKRLRCNLPVGWRTAFSSITHRTVIFDANNRRRITFEFDWKKCEGAIIHNCDTPQQTPSNT